MMVLNLFMMKLQEYCKLNNDNSVLMRFQEKLSLIPKWNQDMLNSECERIMNDSGCDWLDELVTAVFLSHTKILTAVKKANKKQKKINLKIPKIVTILFTNVISNVLENLEKSLFI